jgi:radical SAM protein with 4Fe4S-binding SPASM domain
MRTEPFFMQWHLTDHCNLHCSHCYRDTQTHDLDEDGLLLVLDQFHGFLARHFLRGRINFSGGEPLLRPEALVFLMARARERGMPTRVLTNGTLLTGSLAADLASAGCQAAQISLEGPREIHDRLRGEGAFDLALEGTENARAAGLSTTLSVPVARWNWRHLPHLADLARNYFDRLFVHRFVPCGRGADHLDSVLAPREWRQVAGWCVREARRKGPPEVPLRDPTFACLFQRGGRQTPLTPGGCAVGYDGFAVESNGDVYPCRRLPVVVGNLLAQELQEIWAGEAMAHLRNRDALEGACGRCDLRWRCGGCRAVACALSGSPMASDPQCFRRPSRQRERAQACLRGGQT